MIQKSETQDIDREGRRLLRQALEPLGWVLTGFEEDYAVDYDVQVFVNGSPDGLWFKIQLKSSASSDYSADQTFVSQQLSLDHAKHYALEIRDPIFLIHADTQTKRLFWSAPQLDNELIRRLNSGESVSTITVRVPTSNLLPATAEQFLATVEKLYVLQGHRTLVNSSISSFADSLKYQPGEEKLREEFQSKGDFLRLRKIHELFVNRHYADARSRAEVIVSDPDASLSNKFVAQQDIGSIHWADAISKNRPQAELPVIFLENAKTLQALAKRGPSHLKLFALIARKAAELDELAVQNWGLTILLHQHRTPAGNPLMALSVYQRIGWPLRRVQRNPVSATAFRSKFCVSAEYDCTVHFLSLSHAAHFLTAGASISKKLAKAIRQLATRSSLSRSRCVPTFSRRRPTVAIQWWVRHSGT